MTKTTDYTPPGEGKWTFTGYHMAASMVAFFAVIMFANFTMAWLASSSWTGLVVKNSYVASQQFNERLEAARLQQARGWTSVFTYGANTIIFSLVDKTSTHVAFDNVSVKFYRPVSQDKDIQLVLVRNSEGKHLVSHSLASGVWLFTLVGTGQAPYRMEGRLVVSESGKGSIQ